ncbi:hypothetical protein EXD76_01785 [BEV proteobacterium]|nr:hypothetical protein [Candidatus Symbiopectobacterium sp. Chty_BC]
MKRWILATQNHAVRLHEKTVHLRGQAFLPKLAWQNSMIHYYSTKPGGTSEENRVKGATKVGVGGDFMV